MSRIRQQTATALTWASYIRQQTATALTWASYGCFAAAPLGWVAAGIWGARDLLYTVCALVAALTGLALTVTADKIRPFEAPQVDRVDP